MNDKGPTSRNNTVKFQKPDTDYLQNFQRKIRPQTIENKYDIRLLSNNNESFQTLMPSLQISEGE